MDFRILYQVFFRPGMVFKEFMDKQRLEPLIFVGILSIIASLTAYVGHFEDVINKPWLIIIGLLQSALALLAFPVLSTIFVFWAAHSVLRIKIAFITLLSVFVLCELPYYIEAALTILTGYSPISVGSLFGPFGDRPTLLFAFLLTITPFFVWTVVLWWMAIRQLFKLPRQQTMIVVGPLVLLNLFAGGIWNSFATKLTGM